MIRLAAILLLLTSSTTAGAPVPKSPPLPPQFYPGFLWNWSERTYVVRDVDGEWIKYRCQSHPWVSHNCRGDGQDYDVQTVRATLAEMSTCRQPGFQPHAPTRPEDDQ